MKYNVGDVIKVQISDINLGLYEIKGLDRKLTKNELDHINIDRKPLARAGQICKIIDSDTIGIVLRDYYEGDNKYNYIGIITKHMDDPDGDLVIDIKFICIDDLEIYGKISNEYLEVIKLLNEHIVEI